VPGCYGPESTLSSAAGPEPDVPVGWASMTEHQHPLAEDVLLSPEAGARAIRGSAMRTAAYVAGLVLIALGSVLLIRYLGSGDFGRYATVTALIAIVGGMSDAGLTVVGQREYVVREGEAAKHRLLADILGMRLILTPVAVLLATCFTLLAGYEDTLVLGTLLAGGGLIIASAAGALTLPLSAALRMGAVTATEVTRQVATVAGIALLVLVGAGLLAFFAVQIAVGAIVLGLTLLLLGRRYLVAPRFSWREWWPLARESAPVAASLVVNATYVRVLVVMMSLLATFSQTGLFGASNRILEMLVVVPTMMSGSVFPILAHAGARDRARLAYALQRLGEACFLVAGGLVLALALAAEPIVRLMGGDEFAAAGPVLRIQSLALLGAFLTPVWGLGLVAIRRQRALVAINLVALAVVVALGLVMIPLWDARGAAVAAAVGEAVLAAFSLAMLVRADTALRPNLSYIPKLMACAGVALGIAVLSGLSPAGQAGIALVVYVALAWLGGAVPAELRDAFLRRSLAAEARSSS
jgi:O-antigen/teichoic acid export membrane protein